MESNGGRIMPKQTFFNLPKEKQDILIYAAKKEFSRVPLNEASIANIIKDASIPRGSFYQYFEGKEDAFYYLLEQQTKGQKAVFLSSLQENNGDIFAAFIEMFQMMLAEFQEQENRDFFKNVYLNMDYKTEKKLSQNFSKAEMDKQFSEIIAVTNMEHLNIEDEKEIIHVIQIIGAVTFQNIMHNFAKRYTIEESMENYTFEIELLKRGLYKDNKIN